jgi:hypothetical protein
VSYWRSGRKSARRRKRGLKGENDIRKIGYDITSFYDIIVKPSEFTYESNPYNGTALYGVSSENTTQKDLTSKVFNPFSLDSDFDYKSFRRMYMILSPEILDDKKYQTFKNEIIGSIIKNKDILDSGSTDVDAQFDAYWLGTAKPKFTKENSITTAFFDNLEKNEKYLKNYINYTPFGSKDRLFTFEKSTSPTVSQTTMITGLGRVLANTDKNTWNNNDGKPSVYVSKLKLN